LSQPASAPLPWNWYHVKEWLEHAIGLNMDALHVYFGLGIFVAAALILRRPLRSPLPWLALLLVELCNEYYDWTYDMWPGWGRKIQLAEGLRDVWNTMAVPTFLLIAARWFPGLFTGWGKRRSGADAGEPGGESG
jgi:hypothetical protein